eukprot:gene19-biopygen30
MSGSIAASPQAKRCTIGLLLHKVGEQGVEAVGEVGDGARRLRSGPDVTHGVHGQVHGDGAHVLGVHGDAGLLRASGRYTWPEMVSRPPSLKASMTVSSTKM